MKDKNMKKKREKSTSLLNRRFEKLLLSCNNNPNSKQDSDSVIKRSKVIGKIIENRETGEIKIEKY